MAITTSDIHAAADRMLASGQQPTLAAIRAELGGGSFTTISEAMKTWRAQQQAAATPIREAAPAAVTERLADIGAEIWAIAQGLANDRLASEREALEQTRREFEQQQAEAAELADQLAADLDAAKATIENQNQAAITAQEQVAAQTADVIRLTAELARQTETANTTIAALAEARARAEQLYALLDKEQASRQAAEQRAAAAEVNAAELRGRLAALEKKK